MIIQSNSASIGHKQPRLNIHVTVAGTYTFLVNNLTPLNKAIEGSNVTLECLATKSTVWWCLNGHPIKSEGHYIIF